MYVFMYLINGAIASPVLARTVANHRTYCNEQLRQCSCS